MPGPKPGRITTSGEHAPPTCRSSRNSLLLCANLRPVRAMPHPAHLEPGGLVVWGFNLNNDMAFWSPVGEPDDWWSCRS